MKRVFYAAVLSFGAVAHAQAPDMTPDPQPIQGAGAKSCGKFLQEKGEGNPFQMNQYAQWAWGYISAYNSRRLFGNHTTERTKNAVRDIPDQETVIVFLDNYCRNNPLQIVYYGVGALINELGGMVWVREYKK